MYNHIKKEYLFIFLVLFTALVLFTYFDNSFNYTGLTTKNICSDKGYACCSEGYGEGINYFSLDYSCPSNQQCWSSCSEQVKETNLITSSAVLDSVWSPIKDFFSNIISKISGKEIVGGVGQQQCANENTLFTISEGAGGGHASKFTSGENAYNVPVCAQNFKLDNNGILIIYLSSETNAHVEKAGLNPQNYNIPIKIKTNDNQNPICTYKNSCSSDTEECLFSISSGTNAHIKSCINGYDIKVCCTIPQAGGAVCGNEEIETGEDCEFERIPGNQLSENLNGKTCITITQGFEGGTLHCYPINNLNKCKFDTRGCTGHDTTLPTVSIIYPTNDLTITGTINIEATASDNREVIGVQFKIDSSNIGTEDTTSPYSISWDSTSIVNGQHTITATARDAAGNTQTASVTINVNNVGSQNIPPIIQSDYEVFWANDGIVAFSFYKYIRGLTPEKLAQIQKFKVYRRQQNSQYPNQPINEIFFAKDGENIIGVYYPPNPSTKYDTNFDFWDEKQPLPTNEVTYYYKLVPVVNGLEIQNNQEIQVIPKATTQLTILGQCDGTQYGQCSTNKPQYCGIGNNLIQNNGFELNLNNWNQLSQQQFDIVKINNHKRGLSNVAHININLDHSNDVGLYQEVPVNPNTYYNISMYIKTQNTQQDKPLLEVNCFKVLSDNKKRLYLNSVPISKKIEDTNAQWKLFSYVFKTYNGSNKCRILPTYFPQNVKGEVWIDGIRLETLGTGAPVTANNFDHDCGICGCPANKYCQLDRTCGDQPQTPPQETDCDLTKPTIDNDKDGIRAAFDLDCVDIFDNNILIEEVIPSADEAYTNSDIKVDCKYNIVDSEGEEKRLGTTTGLTIDAHRYVKDCIHAYIYSQENYCNEKEKTLQTGNKIVSFRKCNIGEIPGEGIPVICEVDEKCAPFDVGTGESFITVTEYQYCSEINEGAVEIVNNKITLNSANEPGEELNIKGKVKAAETGKVVVEAALIDLQNGQILKESSIELDVREFTEKSFELKFVIPPVVTKNYFVFVKAYVKNDESNSCIQASKQLKIISDLEEEGTESETSCTNQIDDDNDELTDCEDDDCSTDPACITPCQEGANCNTYLQGVCSVGRQTCLEDGSFGECNPIIQPGQRQEISGNGLDDDCNGQTDETGIITADSDNDGLPDSWEMQNFNTLLYNAEDDLDNDGISNIEEYRENTDPNVSEKKKINLTWLWIILGIIVALILIFILIKFLTKPKTGAGSSYADPRLRSYVQDSLRKGFTKQQIRQALLTKGWSPKDIDNALR